MVREYSVPLGKLVAIVMWAIASVCVGSAWALYLVTAPDDRLLGPTSLFVLSGVYALSVAVVLTIRCYLLRVCRLIRATSGLRAPDPELGDLYAVP